MGRGEVVERMSVGFWQEKCNHTIRWRNGRKCTGVAKADWIMNGQWRGGTWEGRRREGGVTFTQIMLIVVAVFPVRIFPAGTAVSLRSFW